MNPYVYLHKVCQSILPALVGCSRQPEEIGCPCVLLSPCLLKFTYIDILILCRIQFGMGMGLCFGKTMC